MLCYFALGLHVAGEPTCRSRWLRMRAHTQAEDAILVCAYHLEMVVSKKRNWTVLGGVTPRCAAIRVCIHLARIVFRSKPRVGVA